MSTITNPTKPTIHIKNSIILTPSEAEAIHIIPKTGTINHKNLMINPWVINSLTDHNIISLDPNYPDYCYRNL